MHADRRCAIPPGKPGHRPARERVQGGTEPLTPEVRLELIPRITHRRVAVADVHGSRADADRLDRTVAAADHQIEPREVELLDECGKERQALPIVSTDAGQMLKQ